jgi:protein-tyrosine phosphatase
MGNICRSPAAEIVFRKMAADAGLEHFFEIDSAGTIGLHAGKGPDPRMAAQLEKRGYTVSGKSRPLREGDFEKFDLLLTMDRENHEDALLRDPSGKFHWKLEPFVGLLRTNQTERVPDPYYGGAEGFSHVIDLLEDGCAALLERFLAKAGK